MRKEMQACTIGLMQKMYRRIFSVSGGNNLTAIIEYCDLVEKLAKLEHEQWAHWMKYQEKRFGHVTDMTVDEWYKQQELWERWITLAYTPYEKLTEKQKKSDRDWARKVLDLLHKEPTINEAFEKQIRYVMTNNLTLSATQIVTILRIIQKEIFGELKK